MSRFQHQFDRLYRFALSLTRCRDTAEDVAQESLLRAIKAGVLASECGSVQTNQQVEEDCQTEMAWLFRTARNLWIDRLKSADYRRTEQMPVEYSDFEVPVQLELREEIEIAMRAMSELPETQRQVLFLKVIEELSIQEIADVLEMSTGSVKTNLSYARKSMRARCHRTLDQIKK